MCAKHHFICEWFFVFVFITSLGRNCGRTKPAYLWHPPGTRWSSGRWCARKRVWYMYYRAPMMKSWWNHITVRTLLTTTTIFFGAIGFPLGKKKLWKKVKIITYPLAEHSPQVTAHCLYGTRVPTIEKYHFKNGEFPDKQPTVTYGDGDGIVNKRSLEACNEWSQR